MKARPLGESVMKEEKYFADYVLEQVTRLGGYFKKMKTSELDAMTSQMDDIRREKAVNSPDSKLFLDKTMERFEKMADDLTGCFQSLRPRFMKEASDRKSALEAGRGMEKELEKFQDAFVEENEKSIEDGSALPSTLAMLGEIGMAFRVYCGGMAVLGAAQMEKDPDTAREKAIGMVASFKLAYEKEAKMCDELANKTKNEKLSDATYTLMHYLDAYHEMAVADISTDPEPEKNGYVRLALSRTAQGASTLSDLRSKAYHEEETDLEDQAQLTRFVFSEYRGALGAAYAVNHFCKKKVVD